jgi:hypothetical protein
LRGRAPSKILKREGDPQRDQEETVDYALSRRDCLSENRNYHSEMGILLFCADFLGREMIYSRYMVLFIEEMRSYIVYSRKVIRSKGGVKRMFMF